MTENEIAHYNKHFHVRRVSSKCCGNCKHFERHDYVSGCLNETQRDFDVQDYGRREDPWYLPKDYGAWGDGINVDESYVCDLWEKKDDNNKNNNKTVDVTTSGNRQSRSRSRVQS